MVGSIGLHGNFVLRNPSALSTRSTMDRYLHKFVLVLSFIALDGVRSFLLGSERPKQQTSRSCDDSAVETQLFAQYSKLPPGISPFEKSIAKGLDVQGNFRKIAGLAIDRALRDGVVQLEIDFPPFVGGDQSKTQFDDFDNLQELNANRDWCVQLVPTFTASKGRCTWLILPDDKECELAKQAWAGQLYRKAAKFTSIRAAVLQVAGDKEYSKAWGSSIASTLNKLTGGDGILADSSTLDDISSKDSDNRFHLVCQPGNGGPVEDWINVERLHKASNHPTCIVNGALDKIRDGYYPAVFFPGLASTVPFYRAFQAVFILKPISDKGVYGWLYKCYPEPWQVILQTARQEKKDGQTMIKVEETVALVSDERPVYAEIVRALLVTTLRVGIK
jgi:hypothetical protein